MTEVNQTLTETESLAGLRLLVAVAQADETLDPAEKDALEAAIAALPMPPGASLDASALNFLFQEQQDVPTLLAQLESQEARESVYQSMYAMAWADGDCSPVEQSLLDHARQELGIPEESQGVLDRFLREARDTVLPSNLTAIADPAQRAEEIRKDTLKYSIMAAVLGAFPVPGLAILTDLGVVGLQIKLVRDVGQYYGRTVDKSAAMSLLGALGVGTGARIAVNNLAKLLPGWGSVVGASTSFASTWALGLIAVKWFEGGAQGDPAALKAEFAAAEQAGKAAYEVNKGTVEHTRRLNEPALRKLAQDAKDGKITQDEYQQKIAAL